MAAAPTGRPVSRTSSRLSGFVVVGTDTGVGKTLVSCGLLRLAVASDQPLVPFKPAESGCRHGRPKDAAALRAAARRPDLRLDQICPFAFAAAVAPAAAAAATGQTLTRAAFVKAARTVSAGAPLLVETAGGLLSPYSATFTPADLASALALPVLLIARNALGTINHTALALAEIGRRKIPLLGLLLVTTRPQRGLGAQQNAELIEALTGTRPDATIPYITRPTSDRLAAALERSGAGERLLRKATLA
jgi:dethiobiotin synthetase